MFRFWDVNYSDPHRRLICLAGLVLEIAMQDKSVINILLQLKLNTLS